jgi:hypothetical protein
MSGEFSGPPVTLWKTLSSFDHVTASPTSTLMVAGLYCRFLIDTECVAAEAAGADRPTASALSVNAVAAATARTVRGRLRRRPPDEHMRGV